MSCQLSLVFLFDLLDGLIHQFVHGAANLMVGLLDAAGVEIVADLAKNILITGFL